MTFPLPAIRVTTSAFTGVSVTFTNSLGGTPTVFADRFGVTPITLPDTISAPKTYFMAAGRYTVSTKVSGTEMTGSTVTISDLQVATVDMGPPGNLPILYGQTEGTFAPGNLSGGGAGGLLAANNLSDVSNAATAATNLGLGTGSAVQFSSLEAAVYDDGGEQFNVKHPTFGATGNAVAVGCALSQSDTNDLAVSGTSVTSSSLVAFTGSRKIVIAGASNTTANVTGCTFVGNTVTLTLSSTTGFCQGQPVTVASVGGMTNVTGTFTIASVPAPSANAASPGTTITYVASSPSGTYTSGGTAVTPTHLSTTVTCTTNGTGTLAASATNTLATTSQTITAVALFLNNVTLTVSSTSGFYVGMTISVTGCTGIGSSGSFAIPNGVYRITALTSTTITYSYENNPTGALGAYNASSGTVTVGYGAVWGTDDTTAIQNAMNAGTTNGVPVFVPAGLYICSGPVSAKQPNPALVMRGAGMDATRLICLDNNFTSGVVLSLKCPGEIRDMTLDGGYFGGDTGTGNALLWTANTYKIKRAALNGVRICNISQQNNGSQQNYLFFPWAVGGAGLGGDREMENLVMDDCEFGPFSNPWQDAIGITGMNNVQGNNLRFINCARSPDFFTFNYLTLNNIIVRDPLGAGNGPNVQFIFQVGESNANKAVVNGLHISDFYQTGQFVYVGCAELMASDWHVPGQEVGISSITGGATTTIHLTSPLAVAPNSGDPVKISGVFNGSGTGWQALNQLTTIASVTSASQFTVNISTSGATGTPTFNCATVSLDQGTSYVEVNNTGKTYQSVAQFSGGYYGSGFRIDSNGGGWGMDLLQIDGCRVGTLIQSNAKVACIVGAAALTTLGRLVCTGNTWNTNGTYTISAGSAGTTVHGHFMGGGYVDSNPTGFEQNVVFSSRQGFNSQFSTTGDILASTGEGQSQPTSVPTLSSGTWSLPQSSLGLTAGIPGATNATNVGWQPGWINICHPKYGAVGDGTTDCTLAIQKAIIDAANSGLQTTLLSTPGNTVYLPAGEYNVGGVQNTFNVNSTSTDGRIVLLPGVRLVGAGVLRTTVFLANSVVQSSGDNSIFVTGNIDSAGNVYDTFSVYTGTDPSPTGQSITGGTASGTSVTLDIASTTGLAVGHFVFVNGSITGGTGWSTNVNGTWRVTAVVPSTSITITVGSAVSGSWASGGKVFNTSGCLAWGMESLSMNGNNTNQSGAGTSWCMTLFGGMYVVRDVGTNKGYTGDIRSEWTKAPGTFQQPGPNAILENVIVLNSNGVGIQWDGPHDAVWHRVDITSCSNSYGARIGHFHTAGAAGLLMTRCHFSGNGHSALPAVYIDSGGQGTEMLGCIFDSGTGSTGIGLNGLVINANDCRLVGGSVFNFAASSTGGVLFGDTAAITGTYVRGFACGISGGGTLAHAADFSSSDAGPNDIEISVNCTALITTNQPGVNTRFKARGVINSNPNVGPNTNGATGLASALCPGGTSTITSAANAKNTSGCDQWVWINNSGGTAPSVTALSFDGAPGTGLSAQVPTGQGTTPALTWGPFYLPNNHAINATFTGGSTWTWIAKGVG